MASTPPLRHCVPLSVRNLELIHLAGEDGNYRQVSIIMVWTDADIDDIIHQLYRSYLGCFSSACFLIAITHSTSASALRLHLPIRFLAFSHLSGPSSSLSKIESQNCIPVRTACIVFLKLGSCATFPPLEPVQTVGMPPMTSFADK
ncbi:hypothetical protein SCLCIDRAFT_455217 [Scleroderma citrinum Foug A]|uniref:Uncharacterized protein n=1 Tax=Scleroderma citrinum Foug A TaxID=1036808 RepID=A0A0C3DAY9_9AGAM|nr:hypothetical protein SCLCIDRAFT_455217 [Scleroderma citrinum Foug A]